MDGHELKYMFIAQQQNTILNWLEYSCVRDTNFYFGTISSIYYDTPEMHLYREKLNSDYIKTKVRLRWYNKLEEANTNDKVNCFLEVKQKSGSIRTKDRMEIVVSSQSLRVNPFSNSNEEIRGLPFKFGQLVPASSGVLVPMALIQYDRYRFVDPYSGSRVALDTNICCTHVNSDHIPGFPPVHLGAGLLEIKGDQEHLPITFRSISSYLTKEAFSKYARCLEYLTQPFGRRM